MKRVLVTGGAGFVGANLTRRLLEAGHEVALLLKPGADLWRLEKILGEVRIVSADLCDPKAVAEAVTASRPEWVFHLAAHGAYPGQTDARRMVATNIGGTMNVVEAGLKAGVEAIVNTGSSSEYGFKQHPPSEDEVLEPNSHYSWTKAAATNYCGYVAQVNDIHLPTLRLYSVFGPYEEPGRLMPTLVARGLKGELPPLVGPDIARDFVYVDDVTDAYLLAAEVKGSRKGAVYNVGTGIQTTVAGAVGVARRCLAISQEPQWGSMEQRKWDSTSWVSDNRRIVAELGWRPRTEFPAAFELFVEWFRAHPDLAARYA